MEGFECTSMHITQMSQGKVCQVNNFLTFSEKPTGSEEFLNQMVEALCIIIEDILKENLIKWKAKLIRCVPILN